MPTALFLHGSDEDRASLDWLHERPEHPRCATSLQQIMEWTGKHKAARRSLAKDQTITIQRQRRANQQQFREAAWRDFKGAVAQERGRIQCFQISVRRGASDHKGRLASEAEHYLNATDVVDHRSLSLFR